MPQLILHPWFLIFLFTWLSLITLTPKKILPHVFLNSPNETPRPYQTLPQSWPWPWQ